METKAVRINGVPLLVPASELTDPNPNLAEPWCHATEPDGLNNDSLGWAVCTLPVHARKVSHIAHDGNGNVIAIWTDPPAKRYPAGIQERIWELETQRDEGNDYGEDEARELARLTDQNVSLPGHGNHDRPSRND